MYAVVLNVGRRAALLVLPDLVVHPPIQVCCRMPAVVIKLRADVSQRIGRRVLPAKDESI